ncbi:MAG TPA: sugar isomerase domain-containing protein [Acidimicrobiales bacterium]|nr:sugar isomerase domain-containing protein [Acidimicrobiales bacterium]
MQAQAPSGGRSSAPGARDAKAPSALDVFALAQQLLSRVADEQLGSIAAAAEVLSTSLLAGGTVYVFGAGHSRSVAMELVERSGGLAGFKELALDELVRRGLATQEELADGRLERRADAAQALLSQVSTASEDAFIVVSHSGRNGAPVELALEARRRSLPVVAITSLEHSEAVESRHPSGQRLFEVASLSIDTCAPYSDTAISLADGTGLCALSSLAGVLIAQALTVEVVRAILGKGAAPQLLASRNL